MRTDQPPTTPIVVCADDYAFTPGVSRAIRNLIEARRISATSVMTISEFWPDEAGALRVVAGTADIGLHITLTDQKPLGSMPALAPSGQLPSMPALLRAGLLRRLPLGEIEAEIERQLESFVRHWGRPPSHLDGHHHMHQLPGVRDIVLGIAARYAGNRMWVRSCAEAPGRILRRRTGTVKAFILAALGCGLERAAKSARVPMNHGFSGAYDFIGDTRGTAELFRRFVDGALPGALVMCHPGYSDTSLAARDPMTTARESELAYLMSDSWSALLREHNLEVGPLAR